jgi:hypothetical protein
VASGSGADHVLAASADASGGVCSARSGAGLSPAPLRECLQLRRHRLDFGVGLEGFVAHLAASAGLHVPGKPDSGHTDTISIMFRMRPPSQNAMKPRIQRVLTQ